MSEVVFESKPTEHYWNSNGIRLLRNAGSKAVVLKDFKFKIEVVLFARIFDFIYIESS